MARTRKTIEVDRLRELANHMLANSASDMRRERLGVAALLSSVLHETGNYRGFSYLESEFGEGPDGEYTCLSFGDESRAVYH